jgi:CRISPR-associated endonuclease Csn1
VSREKWEVCNIFRRIVMAGYTFGLDIGCNSVGWALVDEDEKRVVDLGVRVFPEGVDRDTKGFEKSKGARRREARGGRRVHQRRRKRREILVRELRGAGLLPGQNKELENLVTESEPYPLRAKGLDERLELHEFGRVLYQINQRRGFKSNRKSGNKKEEGQIAKEAGELQMLIEEAGCRTLGEYFANVDSEEERIRGRYTFRKMYEDEFDLLWGKQAEFYPGVLTDDLRKKVRDEIIFYQRPLKPTDELIGDCDLEDGEKRCARADWYARQFRILQDVNNLKVVNPDGSRQKLRDEQRKMVLGELEKKKSVSFSSLRRKLGLIETQGFNAEYDIDEKGNKREKMQGDEFSAVMGSRKVFGTNSWREISEQEKAELNDAFLDLDDDDLFEELVGKYNLSEEQTEAAMKVELPRGYMRFSRKALEKLLAPMKEGKRTDEALAVVYPERAVRAEGEHEERLGLPEDVRNPLVNRAMFEVRKVVNAVLRAYGRPERIKVEMARDVKGNRGEREKDHFRMRENEKRNDEARRRLMEDVNIVNPTRDDIIKYKLWEECGKVCPYTGKPISQASLFGPNPEFQVEHILPYERSLDDSFINKTLCHVHENIHVKGNQTPYEAYSSEAEKFEQIKQRVNSSAMPYWKKERFWQAEVDTDKIIARELNDTRYITRETVKYLKGVCGNVKGTRGKVTSELGHQWGFIKDRDDHRHHAVDAVITAVTRQRHLRELGRTKYSRTGEVFSPPWAHFREEVLEKVKHINVSHKPRRKVSGALHKETNYGPTGLKDEKGQDIFVYRKRLQELTPAMVEKIVDPVVRGIVKARLAEQGVDSGSQRIAKEVWSEPLCMKRTKSEKQVRIKKVRIRDVFNNMILMEDRSGKTYRAVAPGSNHHIEIYEYLDKKGLTRRDGAIVTMFEAVGRSRRGEPVVNREYGGGKRFVCSLAINEMFMLDVEDGKEELHRVQKIDQNGRIIFRPHTFGGKLSDTDKPPLIQRKSASTLRGWKVTVDCLGRIHRAND